MTEDLKRYRKLASAVILRALLDMHCFPLQRARLVSTSKWAQRWRELWGPLIGIDPEELRKRALGLLDKKSKLHCNLRKLLKEVKL